LVLRLAGMILAGQGDEWQERRCYFRSAMVAAIHLLNHMLRLDLPEAAFTGGAEPVIEEVGAARW
jgi:hypothetical protein